MEGDESLTLNGTVGNAAAGSVTLAIRDRAVTTCTLSGPAGSNIVEGRSYELTATASSPVKADTTLEIMRDAAASDAGPDDYNVESIVIEAGETTGTTTLIVVDDDLPDGGTGTNRVEALVLLGSVDGVELGELTFIIWDAAVPALPVGGALLILLGGVEVDCGFVGRTGPEVETPARGRLARPNGEKAPAGAFSHKRGCRRCPVGEGLLLGGAVAVAWRGADARPGRPLTSLSTRRSTSRFWRLVVVHRLRREEAHRWLGA